jgi:predicted RNA-binding Zn-ribbon protein involved in translation (DUF1610 family)
MGKETCYICGREIEPEAAVVHRIVPEEVAALYGVSDSRTMTLCLECGDEVHDWCHKRVSTITYDCGIKRFRARTPTEIVKEYESALGSFARYKKERRKRTRR